MEFREGGYHASFSLDEAFNQTILDTIDSGLPLTFEYRVEVFKRRVVWMDQVLIRKSVHMTVDFDSLTRQYHLTREIDGQVVNSSVAEKPEEMRRWMTVLPDLDLGSLPDSTKEEVEAQLRVKCRLTSRFVFFFFPKALATKWAKVPLPPSVDGTEP